MHYIDENFSRREMLSWLRGASKNEIVATALRVNKCSDHEVPVYGTKADLIRALSAVDRESLWEAIEAVFPEADDEEDEFCSDLGGDEDDLGEDEEPDSLDEEE
jgi:hypothetical protein